MQQLLIDGHNLIGQMPDLSLADLDDEQKLIVRLRKYAARRGAHIIVVFDSGLPGGRSNELSGGGVTAIFAGSNTIADRILMERIRELKKPGEWIVVSSDREVQMAAARRHLIVWSSPDFVKRLTPSPPSAKNKPATVKDAVSEDDVDDVNEWLNVFGDIPQDEAPAPPPLPLASAPPSPRPTSSLNEDDLNEWLAIFGDVKQTNVPTPPPSVSPPPPATPAPSRKKRKPKARAVGELSPEEVEEWLQLFNQRKPK